MPKPDQKIKQQKRTSHPGHLGARRLWSIHRQRCIPICFVALCSSSPDFLQPFCRSSANVDDALSKKCILLDLEINILYQTIIIILMLYYKVTAVFLNASPSVFFYHTERWKKFNFQEENGRRQASFWQLTNHKRNIDSSSGRKLSTVKTRNNGRQITREKCRWSD